MKLDIQNGVVELAHGSGGRAMSDLVEQMFLAAFDNPWLRQRNDQASFFLPKASPSSQGQRMVMATDSHVITPLFFPGGDIGSLSVHGTVNDVVMSGAMPLYLSAGFILEEGFPLKDLQKIVQSMAQAAQKSNVSIVTGDTKVVERGNADGVYINTTGVGVVSGDLDWRPERIQVGDKVIVSGFVGDHGMTILSQREHMQFASELTSDSQALDGLVALMREFGKAIRCLRDPTRGGIAATLNELAQQAGVGMHLEEALIPVRQQVAAMCEMLGLDPLYLANEGKLIAVCASDIAESLLEKMQSHEQGKGAAVIGEVVEDNNSFIRLKTRFGGSRLVDWRYGDPLPRIC